MGFSKAIPDLNIKKVEKVFHHACSPELALNQ
jgi:hypothetical protein